MKKYILAYKGMLINFFSLSAVKGINMIFPLFLIPYLIRTLGIDNYGKITLYQVIMGYFSLFGTYGSDITAPRLVAMNVKIREKLSEVTSRIIYTRIIAIPFCFLLLILFLIIYNSVNKVNISYISWFFAFTLLISNLTNFSWFYQGIEKMTYVPVVYFFSQLIYFSLVYLFVKIKDDYIYVIFYQGIAEIIINVVIGVYIVNRYNIVLKNPEKKYFISYYKENFAVFTTNISLATYKAASLPILKLFANDYILGVYSIINKLSDILRQILSNFFNVVYPRLCSIDSNDITKREKTLYNIYYPFLFSFLLLLIITYVFSKEILYYFLKNEAIIDNYINAFKFSLLIPLVVVFNIPSYLMLLVYDRKRAYSSILISATIISLFLSLILAQYYLMWGILISTVIVELIITVSLHYVYKAKYKNKPLVQTKVIIP